MDYSIIVPIYNSALSLQMTYSAILGVMNGCSKSFELIFVDDCSKDKSCEVLEAIVSENPHNTVLLSLKKNVGQHTATWLGFAKAKGDFLITIDDDLQFSPKDIPLLIQHIHATGADLVYGTPVVRKHSSARNISSKLALFCFERFLGVSRKGSSFRVFRSNLIAGGLEKECKVVFIDALLAKTAKKVESIPVKHFDRKVGSSGHSLPIQGLWALKVLYHYWR